MSDTRTDPAATGTREAAAHRLLLLDALRFAAAVAVVVYHFTATPTAGAYLGGRPHEEFAAISGVTRYGWLAVELFFVLSGFVILMSAQGRNLAQFVGSRVGRLYPAFWAAVAITALLQAWWPGGRQPSLADTLLNLTMAPDLFGAVPVQVVFWTLLVELKFYVLVGVVVALGGFTPRRVVAFALLWPLAGMGAQALGWSGVASMLVASYAPYFGVGMILYLMRRDGVTGRLLATLAATVAMGVHHLVPRAEHAARLQDVPVSVPVSVTVFALSVAAVWWASGPRAVVRTPWLATALTVAGAITYPLYLVHTQFGYAAIELLGTGVSPWVSLAAALAVSTALSFAIHHAVEKRANRPLRKAVERALTTRRRPRTAADGARAVAGARARTDAGPYASSAPVR
ncbi:acyltransferase family protein [Xylanimonas oleitrophica]|uniref:acyltransferase family protein n=1 Tax=Xylanimonas oleitrophica TaxID=2607479 RepID=UPI0015D0B2F8|nr:acyltransferase [Xylanimonas oleitrophica]